MRGSMSGCTLLATVALAAGCATYAAGGGSISGTPALEGTAWALLEVGGQPARPVGEAGTPTLTLDAAGKRASGNGGCNRYGGGYELNGASLRFGPLVSTKRACAEDALTAQESAFLSALQETRSRRVSGDTLVLSGASGTLARLVARPAP
jgi:heat shock protein HslJ